MTSYVFPIGMCASNGVSMPLRIRKTAPCLGCLGLETSALGMSWSWGAVLETCLSWAQLKCIFGWLNVLKYSHNISMLYRAVYRLSLLISQRHLYDLKWRVVRYSESGEVRSARRLLGRGYPALSTPRDFALRRLFQSPTFIYLSPAASNSMCQLASSCQWSPPPPLGPLVGRLWSRPAGIPAEVSTLFSPCSTTAPLNLV